MKFERNSIELWDRIQRESGSIIKNLISAFAFILRFILRFILGTVEVFAVCDDLQCGHKICNQTEWTGGVWRKYQLLADTMTHAPPG